jgi:hypothetical protein
MMVRRHQAAGPYVGEGGAYVFTRALRTAEEDFVVAAELDVSVEVAERSLVASVDEDT